MNFLIFQLRVSNFKVEKQKLNLRVSNSKFYLIFYEVELLTRKKNFSKNFGVSNSKCEVIFRNSVSQLDFATREFRTSDFFVPNHYKHGQMKVLFKRLIKIDNV